VKSQDQPHGNFGNHRSGSDRSFFPQVIRGAEAAARDQGYTLIAVNSDDDGDRQKELLSILRSQRAEGILLAVAAAPAPVAQITRMMQAGIPVVCVDRIPDRLVADSVSVEDTSAAEMAIDHLLEMGYRRIALCNGSAGTEERAAAFSRIPEGAETGRNRIRQTPRLAGNAAARGCGGRLREEPARNGAGCRVCDERSDRLGVLRAFRQLGMRTPEDLGFITFDELTVDELFSPAVTAIVQPAFEIGFRAAEVLLERIRNRESIEPVSVRLPASLKIRETSRPRGDRLAVLTDIHQMTV